MKHSEWLALPEEPNPSAQAVSACLPWRVTDRVNTERAQPFCAVQVGRKLHVLWYLACDIRIGIRKKTRLAAKRGRDECPDSDEELEGPEPIGPYRAVNPPTSTMMTLKRTLLFIFAVAAGMGIVLTLKGCEEDYAKRHVNPDIAPFGTIEESTNCATQQRTPRSETRPRGHR